MSIRYAQPGADATSLTAPCSALRPGAGQRGSVRPDDAGASWSAPIGGVMTFSATGWSIQPTTSCTPIAALQRLEVQRVVEVRRGRGWFVRRTPATDLQGEFTNWISERRFRTSELLEVRMAIEGMAASLAAARAADGEIDEVAKLSKEHRTAQNDVSELVRTDEEFHATIVRTSRNELMLAIYRMLVPPLTEWRWRIYEAGKPSAHSA